MLREAVTPGTISKAPRIDPGSYPEVVELRPCLSQIEPPYGAEGPTLLGIVVGGSGSRVYFDPEQTPFQGIPGWHSRQQVVHPKQLCTNARIFQAVVELVCPSFGSSRRLPTATVDEIL